GELLDVEKVGEQAVLAVTDHLLHRRSRRRQHHRAAAHGVHHAPGQNEGNGEINMQIGGGEELGQFGRWDSADESELAQIEWLAGENPFLETLFAFDVILITAVRDAFGTDHDEDDIGIKLGDSFGGTHEDVEAAHAFESTADVGDDAPTGGDGDTGKRARARCRWPEFFVVTVVNAAIDTIENHLDFGQIFRRKAALLEVGRGV